MVDGKIYIIVTDQLPNGGGQLVPDVQNNNYVETKSDKNMLLDYVRHRFFNFIQSEAKQLASYSINNIGNFTGDYTKQAHVEEALGVLNFVSNIGMATMVGAQYGGLFGAIIGGGLAGAGTMISINQQVYAGRVENTRINKNIDQLRTRAGLNSINNGSRGTDQ